MAGNFKEIVAVWKDGTHFEATPESGIVVHTDGETQAGASPMELLLISVAGCMGADVISILQKKRQNVTDLHIKVKGERAPQHPKKYTAIEIVLTVTGHDVDPEAVRRAIQLSEETYCSVSATLSGVAKISTRFEVQQADAVPA